MMHEIQEVRQRKPFKATDSDDGGPTTVLDDQEQDEVIAKLRRENDVSNQTNILLVSSVVIVALLLHVYYSLRSNKYSPVLSVFPSRSVDKPLLGSTVLAGLDIIVHVLLLLRIRPVDAIPRFPGIHFSSPEVQEKYFFPLVAMSASLAPLFSLAASRLWQTTVWWCITPLIVFAVYSLEVSIASGNEGLDQLEKLKYRAPGA
ncbi:hypothetical protein FISHEDRAFT_60986 [Fistulina hepatica ATCC 64428]|uniref:Uncharacterized protein n=1 Tax=Fistulina hepatica ATCC 64428 TaxID=1128425 RepID=A0A0D7A6N9_9AGAR|nr:hypothetical protein FISHEDRAFT_60986 [Fistulina hepatica ATCC 64428]